MAMDSTPNILTSQEELRGRICSVCRIALPENEFVGLYQPGLLVGNCLDCREIKVIEPFKERQKQWLNNPETLRMAPCTPLKPCCALCGSLHNLIDCGDCKAIQYCSKEHQNLHWDDHKIDCNRITTALISYQEVAEKLQKMPSNPIQNNIGTIDRINGRTSDEIHSYMTLRVELIDAILTVKTYAALQLGCDHLKDMARLVSLSNEDNSSPQIPSLLMRLGHDQDAYNALRSHRTRFLIHVRGVKPLPLIPEYEDAFEPIEEACADYNGAPHVQIDFLLLKIKLLVNLKALQNFPAQFLSTKMPAELVEMTRHFVVRSHVIWEDAEIMERDVDLQSGFIEVLERDIQVLFGWIHQEQSMDEDEDADAPYGLNLDLWDNMFSGKRSESCLGLWRSDRYSKARFHYTYAECYTAWYETPGALEELKVQLAVFIAAMKLKYPGWDWSPYEPIIPIMPN